jgi:purine nucleosidase
MKRIIIDCDPGIDDAQAIMMAYHHPEVKIEAITTVSGNVGVDLTTANALKVLDILQAPMIPVFKGARTGLVEVGEHASFVHGKDGLGDAGTPESKREIDEEPAAIALIRLAKENQGELELIAIGPLTNLALALRINPDLPTDFKRLVIMGGAYFSQGNTHHPPAEFNIYADPDAAAVVFDNWPNFTMVSWEATVDHGLPFDQYQSLLSLDNTRSAFMEKVTRKSRKFMKTILDGSMSFAADPLAMAVLIDPNIIQESMQKYVQVERFGRLSRGMTVVDWYGLLGHSPNVNIVRKVDINRFYQLYKLAFE